MTRTFELHVPDPDGLETPEVIGDCIKRAMFALRLSQGLDERSDSEEVFTAIGDLIANLLHTAEFYGFSAQEVLTHATYHYGRGRQTEEEVA